VDFAGVSDIGRMRSKNEDSYCLEELDGGGLLLAVADGLGGYLGGEIASAIAVQTVQASLRTSRGRIERDLRQAVESANLRVLEAAAAEPTVANMATTLTAAVFTAHRCIWAHVGDSRAYLWHQGDLRLLTQDHSVAGELVSDGVIAMDDVRFHPQRNVLTRALGVTQDLVVDVGSAVVDDGDWLILATDGLTAVVNASELEQTVRMGTAIGPRIVCQTLAALANARGGPDNVTILAATA